MADPCEGKRQIVEELENVISGMEAADLSELPDNMRDTWLESLRMHRRDLQKARRELEKCLAEHNPQPSA